MTLSIRPILLAGAAIALVSTLVPAAPPVSPSRVALSWTSPGGWLTELRQHQDGSASCATARSFTGPHSFGIFVARGSGITVFALIDPAQPFTQAETMTLTQGADVTSFSTEVQGAALATSPMSSARVVAMFARLDARTLTLSAGGRRYEADLAGIGPARTQLGECIAQLPAAAPGLSPATAPRR